MSSPLRATSAVFVFLLAISALPSEARTRPRWGGRIVIELREASKEIDPRSDRTSPELRQQIAPLLFETLTRTDATGALQPGLASSWTRVHATEWAFTLRAGASFSDGTAVTAAQVATLLTSQLRDARSSAQNTSSVVIDTPQAWDNLPAILSLPRFAIVKENGPVPIGTGPYKISEWQPGRNLVLERNGEYDGAPAFLDAIEIRFNENSGPMTARGTADLSELTVEQARSLGSTSGKRSDDAAQLYALRWLESVRVDERVRRALALAVDRASLALPFTRDGATPASGYLPQNVSGYEFLFEQKPDVGQARSLVRDAGWRLPLPIAYRANDPVARLIAERIAVNAREAGLNVQPFGERDAPGSTAAVARIVRVALASESPAAALFDIAASLGLPADSVIGDDNAGSLLSVERELLNDPRSLPLLHAPAIVWQSRRLHDVNAAADWQLESSWVSAGVSQ
jgi:peptide/nickel transport system substrate-binding protein